MWLAGSGYEGAVVVADHELAWLALNPKNREFYASQGFAPAIQHYELSSYIGSSASHPPTAKHLSDIKLVNGPIDGIQGGKVSSHGKLWVDSLSSDQLRLIFWGVDPYSGIIQVTHPVFVVTAADYHFEAEGLDITEPTSAFDALPNRLVGGVIHAQFLANLPITSDGWASINLNVSDPNRL